MSASFTVAAGSLAGNHFVWVNDTRSGVAVNQGYNKMPFQVVPRAVASPSGAVAGTSVAVYGSGFNGTTSPTLSCKVENATSPSVGPVLASSSSCAETADGRLSGLFVAANVAVGFYIISASDNGLGTPTALVPFTLTGSPTSPVATFTPGFGQLALWLQSQVQIGIPLTQV